MLAASSVPANDPNVALIGIRYATAIPGSAPQVVKEFHPNDVLLGRGSPIVNYEGNVRFREIVATRRNDYVGTLCHQRKDDIAREIVVSVAQLHGRFLRRLETKEETERLGLSWGEKVWVLADEDVAIEKVKQALRDKIMDKNKAPSDSNDSAPPKANSQKSKKKRKQPPTSSELQSVATNMLQAASRPRVNTSGSLPAHELMRHATPPLTVPEPVSQQPTSRLDTSAPHSSPIALLLQQEERDRQRSSLLNQQRSQLQHLDRIRQEQQRQQQLNMLRQQVHPFGIPQLSLQPLDFPVSHSPSSTVNTNELLQTSSIPLQTLQALEALRAEQEERSRQAAALTLLRELQQRRQQQEELLVLQQQLQLGRTREALSNSFGPNPQINSSSAIPLTFSASAAGASGSSPLISPSSNAQTDTSLIMAFLQYQQLHSSDLSPGNLPTGDCLATSASSATMPASHLLNQTSTLQPVSTQPKDSDGSSASSIASSNVSSGDDGKPAAK